jgi:RNA polymerase sigma-70 factor (ECF subfamily)
MDLVPMRVTELNYQSAMTLLSDKLAEKTEFLQSLFKAVLKFSKNRNDAEDIYQAILIRLLEKPNAVKDEALTVWINRVARNAVIDHYRRSKKMVPTSDELLESSPEFILSEPNELDLSPCIETFLNKMNEEDKLLLQQVELAKVPQKDFAERNGINYSTLKSRLKKARTNLKEQILSCCQDGLSTDKLDCGEC